MARAVIVFADGSKRMSHNVDDTNFRWSERKSSEAEGFMEEFRLGIMVRNCDQIPDPQTAQKWHSELTQQARLIGQYITFMNKRHVRYPQYYQCNTTAAEIAMQKDKIAAYLTSQNMRITNRGYLASGLQNGEEQSYLRQIASLQSRIDAYEGYGEIPKKVRRSAGYLQLLRRVIIKLSEGTPLCDIEHQVIQNEKERYERDLSTFGDGLFDTQDAQEKTFDN